MRDELDESKDKEGMAIHKLQLPLSSVGRGRHESDRRLSEER